MNLESLYQKIHHPNSLEASDLPALKELCAKYPYAQLFSVLYLKALAQSKDLHFEDELQQHAYKITDRAKLYELIHAQQDEAVEALPVSVKAQHVAPQAAENLIAETPYEEEKEQPQYAASQTAENKEAEEQIKPQNIARPSREIDELEKEILSGVMATAYSLELEEKQAREVQAQDLASQVADSPLPTENPEALQEKIDLHENRSFTSWLKLAASKTEEPKKESDQLIEKFIKKEPERIKPKTEFYSAPKKAKESIRDDKLVYTETLANIYALQGNYPKAITAFQQLMLTIPEKKLYFAQKIEELNKKINS